MKFHEADLGSLTMTIMVQTMGWNQNPSRYEGFPMCSHPPPARACAYNLIVPSPWALLEALYPKHPRVISRDMTKMCYISILNSCSSYEMVSCTSNITRQCPWEMLLITCLPKVLHQPRNLRSFGDTWWTCFMSPNLFHVLGFDLQKEWKWSMYALLGPSGTM